jgi:DNA-binding NarL/FixJ family response regulator
LSNAQDIEVAFTLSYGEALELMLAQQPVDVLLLDVSVPTGPQNANPYPILYLIPKLLQTYPHLEILVISMYSQRALINSVMEAGASGFILKDDQLAIRELAAIIRLVAYGGIHLSQKAHQELMKADRQLEPAIKQPPDGSAVIVCSIPGGRYLLPGAADGCG